VFVLHVFQKKSMSGIASPRQEMELIRERLKVAEQIVRWSDEVVRFTPCASLPQCSNLPPLLNLACCRT